MKFRHRRQFLHLAVGAVTLPAFSRSARTQTGLLQTKPRTRLITLGTGAGPVPAPRQAKSSNLLTVNGAHYLVDAGDGVSRRVALILARWPPFLSRIITMITRLVSVR